MLTLALAQINPTVGDLEGNVRRILDAFEKARRAGADLVIFSELVLCGYPPRDLIERPGFLRATEKALADIAAHMHGAAALVGTLTPTPASSARPAYNSAAFIRDGEVIHRQHKTLLPTYDVFDEDRYFLPAAETHPVDIGGVSVGITICEDLWNDKSFWSRTRYDTDPVETLAGMGAQLIVNLSSSPFQVGKADFRRALIQAAAVRHERPIFQTNQVGGNDELIFDGRSIGIGPTGEVLCQGAAFEEDIQIHRLHVDRGSATAALRLAPTDAAEEIRAALRLGLRDYVHKCGFSRVVLGLSGGIDSALCTALAAEALGPENVLTVAMPSRYSSETSVSDARLLADNLGVDFEVISIEPLFERALESLAPLFGACPPDATEENIQSRIRGLLLMGLSNKQGRLLLTTGNKSELAVGYCTLYGDMCGGLAPISDLPKALVYSLSRHINQQAGRTIIPTAILEKEPSAELRPDQRDRDSLPPYEILDPILEAYVQDLKSVDEIAAEGFDRNVVERIVRLIETSEFKRRQAAPGLRVTSRAFGMGRRVPIAQRFHDDPSRV